MRTRVYRKAQKLRSPETADIKLLMTSRLAAPSGSTFFTVRVATALAMELMLHEREREGIESSLALANYPKHSALRSALKERFIMDNVETAEAGPHYPAINIS